MALRRNLALVALTVIALFEFSVQSAHAQSAAKSGPLFQAVKSLDARFFAAYNQCDLQTVSEMVSPDLEFYHDKTGLAVGRQSLIDALKANICGKVTRELIPQSLEVYPIAKYGAVEIGVHRFHHPGDATNVGEAKFVTLWEEKDGAWKITRAISFDHQPLAK